MGASGVIKVADFGLSEDIYTSAYCRQKSDPTVKLPVRWMPPESIADGVFTEKSDVVSPIGMQHNYIANLQHFMCTSDSYIPGLDVLE